MERREEKETIIIIIIIAKSFDVGAVINGGRQKNIYARTPNST